MQPTLLAPERLARLLPEPLVVHVTERAVFDAAHVPGAVHVEPEQLRSGAQPAPGRLPDLARLTTLFGRIGLDPNRDVVVMDNEGGGWAGRMAWTLDVIGHRRWHALDGGFHGWRAAGLPLTSEPTPARPLTVETSIDAAPIAEADEILARLDDPELLIWDCRSADEYDDGHIPGAVLVDWRRLMDFDRHLRLVKDPAAMLAARGVDPSRDVITHCATHHRSGLAYMAARLVGFPRIRAYHGGWSEWSSLPNAPVVR